MFHVKQRYSQGAGKLVDQAICPKHNQQLLSWRVRIDARRR